jgi:Zn finger protein HypA/HybF involved in hydrogenase expression
VRRTNVASYEGYCVKCREKRQFEGQEVELANGRRAAQGTCPTCGTKMNRILGKKTT